MNKFLLTLLLISFIYCTGSTQQIQKNFYQTFDLKDEVNTLKFNFPCKVEYRKTSSPRAMIETFVTWTSGNYLLLDNFIKEGEYNTVPTASLTSISFSPKKMVQNEMSMKDGRVIKATINVIVFLPENFYQEGENIFTSCNDSGLASANTKNDMKLK